MWCGWYKNHFLYFFLWTYFSIKEERKTVLKTQEARSEPTPKKVVCVKKKKVVNEVRCVPCTFVVCPTE